VLYPGVTQLKTSRRRQVYFWWRRFKVLV